MHVSSTMLLRGLTLWCVYSSNGKSFDMSGWWALCWAVTRDLNWSKLRHHLLPSLWRAKGRVRDLISGLLLTDHLTLDFALKHISQRGCTVVAVQQLCQNGPGLGSHAAGEWSLIDVLLHHFLWADAGPEVLGVKTGRLLDSVLQVEVFNLLTLVHLRVEDWPSLVEVSVEAVHAGRLVQVGSAASATMQTVLTTLAKEAVRLLNLDDRAIFVPSWLGLGESPRLMALIVL